MRGIVVGQGADMMVRALIAAGFLALWSGSAFAACSATGFPTGQDFEIGANGLLDGTVDSGTYPECLVSSTFLIPFFVPTAQNVEISLSEVPGITGAFYDLTLDPGTADVQTNDQAAIPTTQQGLDTWVVAVPTGLNTLDILENNNSGGFVGDSVSVAMQTFSSIPEPATVGLLGFGAVWLFGFRHRQRMA
jgi:hypothetical protein